MDFSSDNTSGASERILEALVRANAGAQPAYGADAYSQQAIRALCQIFETECEIAFVATGTAANALALAQITPPWGAIFCHQTAHINDSECGAPEFFSHGAKIVGIGGPLGKISQGALEHALSDFPRGPNRQVQPASLSLSQATEAGTLYTCAELKALSATGHAAGLLVHMDGARFANALVALDVTPAEMTWKAGIDVLCLGATKCGAMACEAVIFFNPKRAQDFTFRRKRAGQVLSKGRLFGIQMQAWLENDHWLDLARLANGHAAVLARGLAAIEGVRLPWPTQANEVFLIMPRFVDTALRDAGVSYYPWSARSLPEHQRPSGDEVFVRLVTSFATRESDVANFLQIAGSARKASQPRRNRL